MSMPNAFQSYKDESKANKYHSDILVCQKIIFKLLDSIQFWLQIFILFYPMYILFRESNQEKCIAFLLESGFHKYKRMVYLDRTVIFFIEITSGLQGGILLKTISFIGITKLIHLLIFAIHLCEFVMLYILTNRNFKPVLYLRSVTFLQKYNLLFTFTFWDFFQICI